MAGSDGWIGAAAAWLRDLAVWFGFAGAGPSESSSSSSSSEDEGRSPGAATLVALRLMAASFFALAAARRCSRVCSGLDASPSPESSSDSSDDSSSDEDSAAALSWGV